VAVTALQERLGSQISVTLGAAPQVVKSIAPSTSTPTSSPPTPAVALAIVPIVAAPAKTPTSTSTLPSAVTIVAPTVVASSGATSGGPPSLSLVRLDSKEIKRRNDDELPPLSPLSTAYLERPSEAERARRGRVIAVHLRENGTVKSIGDAIRYLSSLGTTLSEVTFYLRFYIANGVKVNSDFLAASFDDRLLFEGNSIKYSTSLISL
jgi:hypothetical protein